jgi:hypothetical protein
MCEACCNIRSMIPMGRFENFNFPQASCMQDVMYLLMFAKSEVALPLAVSISAGNMASQEWDCTILICFSHAG